MAEWIGLTLTEMHDIRRRNGHNIAGILLDTEAALKAKNASAAPQDAKPECETCARKRDRLLKAGFLKSPLRTKNEEKPLDESARCKECGSFACGGECVRRYEHG